MKRFTALILTLLINILAFSQKDSLIKILTTSKIDSIKASAAVKLMTKSYVDDTSFIYFMKIADSFIHTVTHPYIFGLYYLNKGQYFNYTDNYDSARKYLQKALKIFDSLKNYKYLAASWGELGNSYCFEGVYEKCLECFLNALKFTYLIGDTNWMAVGENNIGNVYYFLKDTTQALNRYKKAYNLARSKQNPYLIALTANNIGHIFDLKNQDDSALFYYNIAVKYSQKVNYLEQLAETYSNLGALYIKNNKLNLAKNYLHKAEKILIQTNNFNGLANTYLIFSQLFKKQKLFDSAYAYLNKAQKIAISIGAKEILKQVYYQKFLIDSINNNFKSALKNYIKYHQLQDSLTHEKVQKQIANLQAKFDLELKEKENKLLKERQAKQKALIQRQKILLISASIILIMTISFLIILYRKNKAIKKINQEITIKNQQLNQQKEEIKAQRDEILAQRNLLIRQQKQITDSINYAKRIQKAMMPNLNLLDEFFKDKFLFYLPRDIVSGDFYWIQKLSTNRIFIAVGDCTGHGVPGAFMSILSMTLLNEILTLNPELSAAKVLDNLRIMIKRALHSESFNLVAYDGLDISAIIFDKRTKTINFAAAFSFITLINNNKLFVLKGDRQPVAYYIKEHPFTDKFIKIQPNTQIFMFTDGYMDQISAELRKFTAKRFKDLLLKIANKPVEEQLITLQNTLEHWKSGYRQIDDILILGFKF